MLKPTLTMVLDRKTVNTTRELMSRLRKALKMELQAGRAEIREDKRDGNLCLKRPQQHRKLKIVTQEGNM